MILLKTSNRAITSCFSWFIGHINSSLQVAAIIEYNKHSAKWIKSQYYFSTRSDYWLIVSNKHRVRF